MIPDIDRDEEIIHVHLGSIFACHNSRLLFLGLLRLKHQSSVLQLAHYICIPEGVALHLLAQKIKICRPVHFSNP